MGWDYSYNGEPTIVDQLIERGYTREFEYGEYGYEWDITEVWSKDGHIFELHASGCSCSSFGDYWSTVDDAIGDMHEVTSVPSFTDVYAAKYFTESVETIQGKYRDLGLR